MITLPVNAVRTYSSKTNITGDITNIQMVLQVLHVLHSTPICTFSKC